MGGPSRVQSPPDIEGALGVVAEAAVSVQPGRQPSGAILQGDAGAGMAAARGQVAAQGVDGPGDVALPIVTVHTGVAGVVAIVALVPEAIGVLGLDQPVHQGIGLHPHASLDEDEEGQGLVVGVGGAERLGLPGLEQTGGPLLARQPTGCGCRCRRVGRHRLKGQGHAARGDVEGIHVVDGQAAGAPVVVLISDNGEEEGADPARIERGALFPGGEEGKGDDQLAPPAMVGGVVEAAGKDVLAGGRRVDQADLQRVRGGRIASPIKAEVVIGRKVERRVKVAADLGPVVQLVPKIIVQLQGRIGVAGDGRHGTADRWGVQHGNTVIVALEIEEGEAGTEAQIGPWLGRIVLG